MLRCASMAAARISFGSFSSALIQELTWAVPCRAAARVRRRVPGPPTLSVADAEVEGGPRATVDFPVRLSWAATDTMTVDYATSNGTATADADYDCHARDADLRGGAGYATPSRCRCSRIPTTRARKR